MSVVDSTRRAPAGTSIGCGDASSVPSRRVTASQCGARATAIVTVEPSAVRVPGRRAARRGSCPARRSSPAARRRRARSPPRGARAQRRRASRPVERGNGTLRRARRHDERDAHRALQLRPGARIGVDRVPCLDLGRRRVTPRGREALALEQGEGRRSLETGDGRNVGVGAALADRDEQRAVLRDPLPLRRVLGDDRAGRRRLGVRAVDDLDLRHGQLVVAGALRDVGARGSDPLAHDVRRAHPGRVVARDRVDAAPGDRDRDDHADERGRQPPAPDGPVRADLLPDPAHDRRRLAEDPRRRASGRTTPVANRRRAVVGRARRAGSVAGSAPRAVGRGDRVAPARRVAVEQAVDERRPPPAARRGAAPASDGAASWARRRPVASRSSPSNGIRPAEQPEEDAAERVEVGRRAGRAAGGLLGRPVLGRPGEHAGDRGAPRRAGEPCEPEVGDDDAARPPLDEHVRRGEVAVDDTARVRVGERGGDRRAVPPRLVPVERPPAITVSSETPSTSSMTSTVWPSFSSTS